MLHHSDSQADLTPSRNGGALGTLGTASRVGGPARYSNEVLYRIDFKIDKCRKKMHKMDAEYKRCYQVLINSEQMKREKDIKAQIQVTEQDLQKLREHYNGMVKYNEGNINAVVKTSQTTKKLMNQMQSYMNEIKIYKHRHLELSRVMRDETSVTKTQH
jgi:hypothetical protein